MYILSIACVFGIQGNLQDSALPSAVWVLGLSLSGRQAWWPVSLSTNLLCSPAGSLSLTSAFKMAQMFWWCWEWNLQRHVYQARALSPRQPYPISELIKRSVVYISKCILMFLILNIFKKYVLSHCEFYHISVLFLSL